MRQQTHHVVTLNMLNDLKLWKLRRELIVEELTRLQADWVILQEVNLPFQTALWLAEKTGYPYVYISPKEGFERHMEGLATLSKVPAESTETLSLLSQNRVAQWTRYPVNGQTLNLINCHLYWQPGASPAREAQVRRLLEWIDARGKESACILGGDFNATPELPEIALVKEKFRSAYVLVHQKEPDYTCPTPLPRGFKSTLKTTLGYFFLLRPQHFKPHWRGTLDYLFIQGSIQVEDCRLVCNQPHPRHARLYPSDHFGISLTFTIGEP